MMLKLLIWVSLRACISLFACFVMHAYPVWWCTGADSVRFKAEINFDGREVARLHINRLNLETILKVA